MHTGVNGWIDIPVVDAIEYFSGVLASFFGWALLSAITIGIVGIFWYNPYYFQTNAELYGVLSRKGNPYFCSY